nr:uncharacterized protein LOC129532780 isoform X2 [Gorilla gorilla gorilla]
MEAHGPSAPALTAISSPADWSILAGAGQSWSPHGAWPCLTERTKWKRRCGSQFLGVDLKKLTTSMSYLLGCSCSQPLCCEEDHVVTRRGRMPGSCSQPSLAHEWAILGWPNSHHARRAGGSSTGPCPTCRFRIKQ